MSAKMTGPRSEGVIASEKKKSRETAGNRLGKEVRSKVGKKVGKGGREGSKITGPTALTIARMFLAIMFFILVLIPNLVTHILALITFIVGAISDLIDGKWARKRQKVTDLGAFLDPLADKMLTSLAFLALVDMQIIPIWVFAVILVRDFAVDGMRMMAAREGTTIAASKYGKLKTVCQLVALIMILANLVLEWSFLTILGNIVLYVALALTVFSGIDYLAKSWRKMIR